MSGKTCLTEVSDAARRLGEVSAYSVRYLWEISSPRTTRVSNKGKLTRQSGIQSRCFPALFLVHANRSLRVPTKRNSSTDPMGNSLQKSLVTEEVVVTILSSHLARHLLCEDAVFSRRKAVHSALSHPTCLQILRRPSRYVGNDIRHISLRLPCEISADWLRRGRKRAPTTR